MALGRAKRKGTRVCDCVCACVKLAWGVTNPVPPSPHPHRQNCILADEMGLGKTIQSIAFLQEVYNVGIRGPFLVIAPLSTITNWEREFNTWTEMNSIVYHGSLASRQMIQQYEMYCKDSRVWRWVDVCRQGSRVLLGMGMQTPVFWASLWVWGETWGLFGAGQGLTPPLPPQQYSPCLTAPSTPRAV